MPGVGDIAEVDVDMALLQERAAVAELFLSPIIRPILLTELSCHGLPLYLQWRSVATSSVCFFPRALSIQRN